MTALLRCARHAPIALEQRCYGRLDVAPGEDARRSADQLARSLPVPAPRVFWTSPLRRCREVAEHLAALTGAELQVDDRLAEMDFGAWEGCSWEQIEQQYSDAYRAWLAAWRELSPPGGETVSSLERRVQSWLLERAGEIESAALVGHAGVIRALCVLGGSASWDDAFGRPVPYLEWLTITVPGSPV
jgi:alpha-ribazole phosphatase